MINFRYHLVSLAAVLLALAAGVLLGAGVLDEPLGGSGSSTGQQAQIDALDQQVNSLQGRVSYDDAAAAALAPAVLPGQLAGASVVVVVTPGTDGTQVAQLVEALKAAGATVTGQVDVQEAWFDPGQASVLTALAEQLVPPDVELPAGGPVRQGRRGARRRPRDVRDPRPQ